MPDLIAQGSQPHHRWRRALPADKEIVLGRASDLWATPWDEHISRRHVVIRWRGGGLEVTKLAEARNPVFLRGEPADSFAIRANEHFVIGGTTFTVVDEPVRVALDAPQPVGEHAFKSQDLRHAEFRDADERIAVLSRLPEIISGAADDNELCVRLVNLLLSGVPRAAAAAIVSVAPHGGDKSVKVLHWDRRILAGGEFSPSERLIHRAVEGGESVLHVWGGAAAAERAQYTLTADADWAVCTPVPGQACRGWGLYLSGRFENDEPASENEPCATACSQAVPSAVASESAGPLPNLLRDDVKFTELAATTLGNLRESQRLLRRQTSLSQFFAPVVLEALSGQDPDVVLAPREADVSVLFCDLRGFSRTSERSADDLLGLLNRVSRALGVMTRQILDQGGVVGDFHGDAAMGFWGWPLPQADAAQRACRAALAIRAEFANAARQADHALEDFRIGIGVASGRAVAGKIGTVDQVKVTVFGPVVNLASRLEEMTKYLRAPILLDEPTARVVREHLPRDVARVRRVAVVRPFNLSTSLEVSELLPPLAHYPQLTDDHIAAYEAAVAALLARDWPQAFQLLHHVPADDRVKDFLTVFIAQHNRTPPENWDGVIPLAAK